MGGLRRRGGSEAGSFLLGGLIAAGLMFLLDPDRGVRRRAWIRDKFVRAGNALGDRADKRLRDVRNRTRGFVYEIRNASQQPVSDDVLRERVRAQLGHVLSHPGAIEITIEDGQVVISGPIFEGERAKIEDRLRETRGVRDWDLRVEEHASSENVPGLQGESRSQRRRRRRG